MILAQTEKFWTIVYGEVRHDRNNILSRSMDILKRRSPRRESSAVDEAAHGFAPPLPASSSLASAGTLTSRAVIDPPGVSTSSSGGPG